MTAPKNLLHSQAAVSSSGYKSVQANIAPIKQN